MIVGFRPLTGIKVSELVMNYSTRPTQNDLFPSPHGD